MFLFFRREHHPDLWIEIRRSEFAAEAASLCAIRPSPNVVRPCIRDDRHSMTVAVNGWRVVQKLRIRAACGAGRRGAAALRRRGGRGVCRQSHFYGSCRMALRSGILLRVRPYRKRLFRLMAL